MKITVVHALETLQSSPVMSSEKKMCLGRGEAGNGKREVEEEADAKVCKAKGKAKTGKVQQYLQRVPAKDDDRTDILIFWIVASTFLLPMSKLSLQAARLYRPIKEALALRQYYNMSLK